MTQSVVMAYNFSITLMNTSNTVVDPNNLLASTDSAPSALSVVSVVSNVASVSASFGGSIGGSVSVGGLSATASIGGSISASIGGGGTAAASSGVAGGFQECTGLDTSLEIEDYKEGGLNDRIRKFPSRVTWSNIVLKRGIGLSDDLWNWHAAYMNGTGVRRDGIIVLENDQHVHLKQWQFSRGLPIRWTGPAFNAKTSEVAIESLEIVHEGITLTSPSSVASAAIGSVSISVGISL